MAVGIWTPVVGSAVSVSFGDRLSTLADRVRTTALAAGTHMRFNVMGCLPVYVHTSNPATDVIGLTGTPITEDTEFVLPRAANIWIYSPYENTSVIVSVGALT